VLKKLILLKKASKYCWLFCFLLGGGIKTFTFYRVLFESSGVYFLDVHFLGSDLILALPCGHGRYDFVALFSNRSFLGI
jgi:hypothetical protein